MTHILVHIIIAVIVIRKVRPFIVVAIDHIVGATGGDAVHSMSVTFRVFLCLGFNLFKLVD